MSEPLVLVERAPEGYAVVTLNRPDAMNALSRALRAELARVFDELADDPAVRVVVLTGAGRAFTAGLDLKELGASAADGALFGQAQVDPVAAMARFKGPIIGAVNGAAITGGFELALNCDLLLASSAARFADTHARVGVMPGWGLSQRLSRLVGPNRAKELSLTGNFLGAQQALAWGLVNRVLEPAELMPAARALARDMLSVLPHMLVQYKRLIDDGFGMPFGQALQLELKVAREKNQAVTASQIEQRREAIRERGRQQ